MKQRIMLRDRKYLHVELIGPGETAARIIVWLPEIAKLQPRSRPGLQFALTLARDSLLTEV